MFKQITRKLAFALALVSLTVPAEKAFAQSTTPAATPAPAPNPNTVTGTDPEPQFSVEQAYLSLFGLA